MTSNIQSKTEDGFTLRWARRTTRKVAPSLECHVFKGMGKLEHYKPNDKTGEDLRCVYELQREGLGALKDEGEQESEGDEPLRS